MSAGSAGDVADQSGHVKVTGIPASGQANRFVRYLVSVNGNDMLKEALLPSGGLTMLWDFNSDEAMSANMGKNDKVNVSWEGGSDGKGNEYYTFTATGSDPHLSIDMSAENASDFAWCTLRVKNLSGAKAIELFGHFAGKSVQANSCTHIDLEQDGEWHTYLVNIPEENIRTANTYKGAKLTQTAWSGTVNWLRLDPTWNSGDGDMTSGDQIQIDYVAFFSTESAARSFNGPGDADQYRTISISSNFPNGVSPVTSAIFSDIQISGTMSNSAYQIVDGTYIPVILGRTANMTVKIKPQTYSYSYAGPDGKAVQGSRQETPLSVQLVVCDEKDVLKGVYPVQDKATYSGGYFNYSIPIDFVEPDEDATEEEGNVGFIPRPGDKLYLRLVTDRLAQTETIRAKDDLAVDEYQYTDVFTGMYFSQPVAYEMPPEMGIKEPIDITFANLPLIGNTGLNLNFPFVNVGIMHIQHGFRIYIGFSPVQIMDTIKGSHMSSFAGDDGQYWKSLFSIKSPFESFSTGFAESKNAISDIRNSAKEKAANNEKFDTGSLGSPSWRFDIMVGMYFDFTNPTVTNWDTTETEYIFNGMGGYLSVTLGFKMAWYFILPVVFLPAYIGIEIQGTVMGFLGADFNKEVQITYDDSLNGSTDINDGINSLNGAVRALGYVQLSFGVGLCGTLGVRASGRVSMIANWEPTDSHGAWGLYISMAAGLIIDLFLFSIPLMYTFAGWPFGSFDYYANPEKWSVTPGDGLASLQSGGSTLQLRAGSGADSVWVGSDAELLGAFEPNKQKETVLAENAYERPDSQLITLRDGETLVLAFLDSDNAKGGAQRTTLKLATYANGAWSRPVVVSNDDTADFQPSIAETKDGKILVAWVSPSDSTITDLSTDEQVMKYLNSMEVFAAFVELDNSKQIKTTAENGVTVADTEVARISNDHYARSNGSFAGYYDANPTVVCDMVSGDAMVSFIKSGRSSLGDGQITDYINPYPNDCVVCYLPYNAAEDIDTDGRTVPAGWLTENFYFSELDGDEASEVMLRSNFSGQRFLDGPLNGSNERYAIPDFTAVSYNGLAVYAYTVDKDGRNDTDVDKELFLQVYDFSNHETKHRLVLTDDALSDTMPQLFRSKVNTAASGGASTDDESTHTKLFWYKDGNKVVYLDVTELIRDGINDDGTLKTKPGLGEDEDKYVYTLNGETHYRYTEPKVAYFFTEDSHASLQSPDFRAVEDAEGNLYILWTEGVTEGNGSTAREIFATGLVTYVAEGLSEDGTGTVSASVNSGWSKPYRLTREGYFNDELAVAMSGENLVTVHNRFREELVPVPEGTEYTGQISFMPIQITDMALVADTLEPCGSVETESITLSSAETVAGEDGTDTEVLTPVTLPSGGEKISIEVAVANNGMNVAQGYQLNLYAVDRNGSETQIGGTMISNEPLAPNMGRTLTFEYTLPADVDGLAFKAVTQEMEDATASRYYSNTNTYVSDPLEAKAAYEITEPETYQDEAGFHARFTVTNTGNAMSSPDDNLTIRLKGPADLGDAYTGEQGELYSEPVTLGVGGTKTFDVPVSILPEMIADYGFVTALVTVQKEVAAQTLAGEDGVVTEYKDQRILSNMEYADFDLAVPMNMKLQDVSVAVEESKDISFSMDLGDKFRGGDTVTYAVDDLTVATVENGKVVGVNGGTTTLFATHASTGATVSSAVTVTGQREISELEIVPASLALSVGDTDTIAYSSSHDGSVTFVSSDAKVAAVNSNGTVRAVAPGTTTVTLTDGAIGTVYTASCPVTVSEGSGGGSGSSGGGGSSAATNPVNLPDAISNGSASSSASRARPGQTVTVIVTPDEGYQVTAVTVTDGSGKAVVVKDSGDGTWSFTMPGSVVTVTPTFTRIGAGSDSAACKKDTTCPISKFTDASPTEWYHDGGHWALDEGVMNRIGNNLFAPNNATTRAMLVTMLWRMENQLAADTPASFGDVPAGAWYADAVAWAAEKEIVKGYNDKAFGSMDPITREQLATILYRHAQAGGADVSTGGDTNIPSYSDASSVSDWAASAMQWAVGEGIINGKTPDTLNSTDNASRAEVATMLMRFAAGRTQ